MALVLYFILLYYSYKFKKEVTFECENPIKRDLINNNDYYTRGTMIIVDTMFKIACR